MINKISLFFLVVDAMGKIPAALVSRFYISQ